MIEYLEDDNLMEVHSFNERKMRDIILQLK